MREEILDESGGDSPFYVGTRRRLGGDTQKKRGSCRGHFMLEKGAVSRSSPVTVNGNAVAQQQVFAGAHIG